MPCSRILPAVHLGGVSPTVCRLVTTPGSGNIT